MINGEPIEPEILREMRTPKLDRPKEGEFQPYFRESDLPNATRENMEILKAISVVGQYVQWNVNATIQNNEHTRQLEASQIRMQKKILSAIKYLSGILLIAIVTEAVRYWFHK